MLDFKWYYLILIELLIYFKNNFICGLAYLITRHKKEYIFLNRNFSEIILRVYISDEESVSPDSSNDHCNSLDSTYLSFIEFSLNRAGCVEKSFKPSASRNHKLDPDLYVPGETRRKKLAKKEKMKPEDQKCFAANKPRQSFKNLPDGWTRDTVGISKICVLF